MEEDIKILEDYIQLCKTTGMDKLRAEAIENLIARNKELEETKSKVREKIEEINKAYEDSKDENGESEYYYPDYTIEKLEELLQ